MAEATDQGELRRFLLEQQPVRGHWVRLGEAWLALQSRHSYPAPVAGLLGEAATAVVLLAATLKFEGTLTLQLTGDGRVRMLVAQCTDDHQLRAIAHHDVAAGEAPLLAPLHWPRTAVITIFLVGTAPCTCWNVVAKFSIRMMSLAPESLSWCSSSRGV